MRKLVLSLLSPALANSTSLVNGPHYRASQMVGGTESAMRLEIMVTFND